MEKNIRKIHQFDATGESVGRLASQIALILRGKHKTEYLPHQDLGDLVEVKNINKLRFTGKKLKQKKYFHYSGYHGGLKEVKLEDLFNSQPDQVLKKAVKQMLPANRLRVKLMKRLIIR